MQSDAARSDAAIEDDIHDIIVNYPPLSHGRHHIDVVVEDGHVTITGHVKTDPTELFLKKTVQQVPGVKSLNADELYSDSGVRLDVAKKIPYGVYVQVEYGSIVLTGKLPEGMKEDDLVKKVRDVPGVHRVITKLSK